MRVTTAVFLVLFLVLPAAARAEEAWLRSELLMGIDLIFNADISGGKKVFAEIERRDPTNPAPYIYRAMALMSYPPREGMEGIDRALIESLLETGIRLAEEGDFTDDQKRVNLLLATAYSLSAQLLLDQNEYLEAGNAALKAKKYLDEARRIAPGDPDVRYAVGIVTYGMSEAPAVIRPLLSMLSAWGDKESAIRDLMAAAESGVYARTSARVALLVIFSNIEKRYTEAAFYGEWLIEKYPDNPEFYFPYVNALSESGDHAGALSAVRILKEKIDSDVPYFDGAIIPRYHHLMGKILMDEGRLDDATAEFSRALVVTDKNYAWVKPLALSRLGMIRDLKGDRSGAVEFYKRALDTGIEGAGMELAEKYLKQPYRIDGGNERAL